MRYVAQRHPYGCVVAALAMVCDKEYDDVLRCFYPYVHKGNGLQDGQITEYLFRHGWAWQQIFRVYHYNRGNLVRPWPPAPWAPRHLVRVQMTGGQHMIVMDANGDIADPSDASAVDVVNADYLGIDWVMGCWRVAR